MADVFISYHRSEGTSVLVRRIARELESMGISCWYDTKDPNPGYFVQTIEQEILRCKVFLLIWDEGANNSEWCLTETYTAFEGENHAVRIPFQIGQFKKHPEMSFYMRRCQIFSHESPENADIQKLIVKIAALFGKNPVKIIKSGVCGHNATYTLDENGTLNISALESVASIEDSAFYNWSNLTSVILSDSVISIGAFAFELCTNLSGVVIPDSVVSIGYRAFDNCKSLSSVIIPDSVTVIGYKAFGDCKSLINVTIPNRPTEIEIGDEAFSGCVNLKSVSIPGNTKMWQNSFPKTTKIIRRK